MILRHYFPFFILAILIYGFFFYSHEEPTVIPSAPIDSGQQVQLQIIETAVEEKEKEQLEVKEEQVETSDQEKTVAKQKLQKAIQETTAINDASLKAELFAVDFDQTHKVPESDLKLTKKAGKRTIPKRKKSTKTTLTKKSPTSYKPAQASSSLPWTNRGQAEPVGDVSKRIKFIKKTAPTKAKPPTPVKTVEKITKAASAKVPVKAVEKTTKAASAKVPVKGTEKDAPAKPKNVFKKQPTASKESTDKVQEGLQEAVVVSGNTPVYPKTAILRNQEGRVVVKLTVTMKGKAKNPEIITSSGHPLLDNAILDFVQKELFMPAHKGEEKIATEQVFSFRFELK